MTLCELALSYQRTAIALRSRIVELETRSKTEDDPGRKQRILNRIRPLRSMYRDTRRTANYLTGYYQRSVKR